VATGLGAQLASAAAAAEPAHNYARKDELPTPALLVDLDAFEANVKLMAEHCKRAGCGFRPHAKTHKCPEIARRLVSAGALGATVATLPEAEAMVAGGIRGVLLTSPIVERNKIARMVELAKKGGEVMLSVSHPREVELLGEATEANRVTLDVLVDLDVGDRRTGILPGKSAVELAQVIAKQKGLRLRGVQAYSGRSSHTKGFENRAKVSREAMTKAVETRDLIAKEGLDAPIVSGGSTGTYNIDSEIRGVTELQVGSFIFMDANYRAIGGKNGDKVYTDFQPSLFVLTTVVNTTHPELVSLDAGTKAFATDVRELPEAKSWEGVTYGRSGDEFGRLTPAVKGAKLPRLGDRLEFIVSHCDPTVNLYDRIYAVRGDRVEEVWAVVARREFHTTKMRA
jgi:D-serine deaminase-like pyridoxal phosphate-dependent protein